MALLDAIAGRAIPEEGRVWVSGVPLVHGRESQVRELVAVADLSSPILEGRSALWNTLARRPGLGALGRFLRFPAIGSAAGRCGRSLGWASRGARGISVRISACWIGPVSSWRVASGARRSFSSSPRSRRRSRPRRPRNSSSSCTDGAGSREPGRDRQRSADTNAAGRGGPCARVEGRPPDLRRPAADLLRRASAKIDPGYPGSAADFDHPSRGRASDRVSGLGQGVGQRLEKDEV